MGRSSPFSICRSISGSYSAFLRSKSPTEMWAKSLLFASSMARVPLPAPGAPRRESDRLLRYCSLANGWAYQ